MYGFPTAWYSRNLRRSQVIHFLILVPFAFALCARAHGASSASGVAKSHAVVNFSDLARQEMLNPDRGLANIEGEEIENNPMPPAPPVPMDAIIITEKPKPATSSASSPGMTPQPFSPPAFQSFQAAPDNNHFIPPDTHGAVGPNHLMVTLNGTVEIQDRTGVVLSSVTLHTFWSSVSVCNPRPQCEFDPKILYDPYGQRWIFTAAANGQAANSEVLIGVSQTNDPTGNWNLYMVVADNSGTNWADFPSIGFTKDWIVVTFNMFPVSSGTFRENLYVFNKASLYAGGTGTFTLLTQSDGFTMAPAVTYDNTVATMYLLQNFNGNFSGSGFLRLATITGPVGSEVLNIGPFISTPNPWSGSGTSGGFAPQSGIANLIDTDDSRIINLVYRNGSLWAAQTVFLPAGAPTRSSVQWWQLATDGTVQQRGRIDDSSGVLFRAYPSISVNQNNDALIGYSLYSSSIFASAAYSFRAGADPANTLQSENVLKAGLSSYFKTFGGPRNRWGDYSYTQVDPLNDTNLWTIQEYADTLNNEWATWWGEIALDTATHLQVSAPASAAAGSAFSITVTAQGASNNTVNSYTGTVHFTSSDGQAILPADYTFLAGDNGVHTFSVTLGTPGSQTVTATDAGNAISGTSAGITVSPGAANHFNVTGAPASVVAGNAFNVTVTAKDSFNNTVTTYAGTVRFTSGDSQAVLPGNSTLTSGVGTFSVTLKTAGSRTVTATDTVNGSITGSSSTVDVTNAIASKYSLTSPPTATANMNFTIRLVAQDQFNNTAKDYTGTVHFTTSDAAGGVFVPPDYPFVAGDNGQKIFNPGFTLQTLGAQTITATDKSNGSITITNNITVTGDAFITPQGRAIHIFRANIPVVVASFTDSDLAETGSNYTVSINWGDGSPPDTGCTLSSINCKIVRVSTNPNVFNVIGAHTYKKKGGLTVQVSLTDSGGSKADAFSTARFFPINSSH